MLGMVGVLASHWASPPPPQDAPLPAAPMAAAELTPVETAIETIVTVFVSHTRKEGRMGTMTATAFQELLRLQLPNVMKVKMGCGGLAVGGPGLRGDTLSCGAVPCVWGSVRVEKQN